MNKKFVKAWVLLALSMAVTATAYASEDGGGQNKITVRTVKIDGKVIGLPVSGIEDPVGFDCGYFKGNIVFANKRTGDLNTSGYNASGRAYTGDRAPSLPLSEQAFDVICSTAIKGEFEIDIGSSEAKVTNVSVSASSRNQRPNF